MSAAMASLAHYLSSSKALTHDPQGPAWTNKQVRTVQHTVCAASTHHRYLWPCKPRRLLHVCVRTCCVLPAGCDLHACALSTLQETEARMLVDLTMMLQLWLAMTDRYTEGKPPKLFSGMPAALQESVPPVLDLAATVLHAYPGPGLTENSRKMPASRQGPRLPASELAAHEAAQGKPVLVVRPQEEGTACFYYKDESLTVAGSIAIALQIALSNECWSPEPATDDPLNVAFLQPRLSHAALAIAGSHTALQLTMALLVSQMGKLAYKDGRETATMSHLQKMKSVQQRVGTTCLSEFPLHGNTSVRPFYKQLADVFGPLGRAGLFLTCCVTDSRGGPSHALLALGVHCTAKGIIDAMTSTGSTTSTTSSRPDVDRRQPEILPRELVKPLTLALVEMAGLTDSPSTARRITRLVQMLIVLPGAV